MYPGLTWPLLGLLALTFAWTALVALRETPVRRLAGRQLTRRRAEAGLVIAGSMLGTAIIVGSLSVGDTLQASIERGALANLGPVDEIVTAGTTALGEEAAQRLAGARHDPDIDGLLTVRRGQASAAGGAGGQRKAEPRASLWEVDFGAAASFGGAADGGSELAVPPPAPGEAILNADLAGALNARAGDTLTFYLAGRPMPVRVARIVPTAGLAALQDDDGASRNAFFAPGTLAGAASQPLTLVSNAGGVVDGARLSNAVVARLTVALGPLASRVAVDAVKRDALDRASAAANDAGSMLLSLGGFAIIAGVLLLANVFVMLIEERTAELGMLRALGMRRRWLVHSLMCEGMVYALVASIAGVAVGIGLGRAIAGVAGRWFAGGATAIEFDITPASLVNGFAFGLLAGIVTVLLVSLRVSRLNVVAALRDLRQVTCGGRGAGGWSLLPWPRQCWWWPPRQRP
jgi:putative ABC transport system permease protein